MRASAISAAQSFQDGLALSCKSSTSFLTRAGSRTPQTASICKRSKVRSVATMSILSDALISVNLWITLLIVSSSEVGALFSNGDLATKIWLTKIQQPLARDIDVLYAFKSSFFARKDLSMSDVKAVKHGF